ncbi:hypothetical protein ACTFIY_004572 [Dictyostelium cf. discoideum]
MEGNRTDKMEYYYNLMLENLCNMVASNASEVHEITRSFCEVLSDYKKYTDGDSVTIESRGEYIIFSTKNINGEIGLLVDFDEKNKEIAIEVSVCGDNFIHLSTLPGRMETHFILIPGSKWNHDRLKIRFEIIHEHQIIN